MVRSVENSRTPGIVVTAFGAAALIAALFIALAPISYSGVDCGSVLAPANLGGGSILDGAYADIVCERETAQPRGFAIALTVIGAIALVAGLIMLGKYRGHRAATAPVATEAAASTDLSGQLAELARLRTAGALTAEEFDQAKRRLLGTDDPAA